MSTFEKAVPSGVGPTKVQVSEQTEENQPDGTTQQLHELESTSESSGDHVNVEEAQNQWNQLSKQVSRQSSA